MKIRIMNDLLKYVSRETFDKFSIYEKLLHEWNRQTALVQMKTLNNFYYRHVLDSLQIIPLINQYGFNLENMLNSKYVNENLIGNDENYLINILSSPNVKLNNIEKNSLSKFNIIDIGSGAGFPGLALAICNYSNITLCESNIRKCIFLEEVKHKTSTNVVIENKRVEDMNKSFNIIISRATSNLKYLLEMMLNVSRETFSIGLFHKGKNFENEILSAQKKYTFSYNIFKSITCSEGRIIYIYNLRKII